MSNNRTIVAYMFGSSAESSSLEFNTNVDKLLKRIKDDISAYLQSPIRKASRFVDVWHAHAPPRWAELDDDSGRSEDSRR